jgi:hypothetical protein
MIQNTPAFLPLTGVYEPSAIQQLPDGRFLVVEDEKEHPFSLVTLDDEGQVDSQALTPGFFEFNERFWKLDDLEGLTLDPDGFVLAITSHSRNGDGDEKKSRDKIVRFRVDSKRIVDTSVSRALKPALCQRHDVLATASRVLDVKAQGGLNIEALDFCPRTRHLLIGLRSPLIDGKAVIARCENPAEIFDSETEPRIAPSLITLDLGGHGLRGMAYIPALAGHLLISGPMAREATQFRLWFWNGNDAAPRRVELPGLAGFEHAEGISPALVGGQARIIMVSDDGNRQDNRPARYLLISPAQLRIAP